MWGWLATVLLMLATTALPLLLLLLLASTCALLLLAPTCAGGAARGNSGGSSMKLNSAIRHPLYRLPHNLPMSLYDYEIRYAGWMSHGTCCKWDMLQMGHAAGWMSHGTCCKC